MYLKAHKYTFVWNIYLGVALLDFREYICSTIRVCRVVFQRATNFHSHQEGIRVSVVQYDLYVVVFLCSFNLHSLMTNEVDYLFICLLAI